MVSMVVRFGAAGGMGCRVLAVLLPNTPWLLVANCITGLGSGIDKDRPDYTVFTGEWEVGRNYQTRGGPDSLRWFWSLTVNGPMTR
jgi:hypothetical protein